MKNKKKGKSFKSKNTKKNEEIKKKIKELKNSFEYKKSNKSEKLLMIKNIKKGEHPRHVDIAELFGDPSLDAKSKKMKGGAEENTTTTPETPAPETPAPVTPAPKTPETSSTKPTPNKNDPIDSFLGEVGKNDANPPNTNSTEKVASNEEGKGLKDEFVENLKGFKDRTLLKYNMLQDEEGFNIFEQQEEFEKQLEGEGLYLVGINLKKILDLLQEEKKMKELDVMSKLPGTTNEEKKILTEEMQKIKKEKEKREGNKISSYDLLGEHIDEDFEKISQEISGIQEEISEVSLNPQKVFDRRTTFSDILTESKKYKKDLSTITPKAIYKMVQILDKKKVSLIQWTRIASFCEIIYKYLNKGESREKFFNSTTNLNEKVLSELEEFWKTDFIFRGNEERKIFKDTLDFYKNKPKKPDTTKPEEEKPDTTKPEEKKPDTNDNDNNNDN